MNAYRCHICGSHEVNTIKGYETLSRVTSDCKPWNQGGVMIVCDNCGTAQAPITDQWKQEAESIYRDYTIYHQSGGMEQSVFDSRSGMPTARSAQLLKHLLDQIELPTRGCLLDVGCGNGQLLGHASRLLPEWTFAGIEFDERHRNTVEKIPRVKQFHAGSVRELPGKFNVITLVHVLEHLAEPRDFLTELWDKLLPGGLLIVDVPHYERNPFILLVADHCTHFTTHSVTELLASSGYQTLISTCEWIPKEATVVAKKMGERQKCRQIQPAPHAFTTAQEKVDWLVQLRKEARESSKMEPFGIFGTSIGATFLKAELGDKVSFFLDEDPHRIGKSHLGCPIQTPDSASKGSHVFIPLAPEITTIVVNRLKHQTQATFHWMREHL